MDESQIRFMLAAIETAERLMLWMAERWKDEACPECGGAVVHMAGCKLDAILQSFPPPVDYAKDSQPPPVWR